MTQQSPVSPRITALEHALAEGDTAALATFWQEIAEHGTPLLEPIEGDEAHNLVTFLWHDTGATTNVVVAGGIAGWDTIANNQMTRLLDTDLWYRTYRVQSDLRIIWTIYRARERFLRSWLFCLIAWIKKRAIGSCPVTSPSWIT